jgi:hypothetical protein
MKINILILLLILTGCAKPADPTKSANPVYGSLTTVISGVETDCNSCVILESSGTALRVTFTENFIDECSGEGTLSYLSDNNLNFPQNNGEITDWTAQVVGDNNSKNQFCFPDVLSLTIEKISDNLFEVDYNGKFISVKKLN